jgi:Caspase domain
MKWLGALALFVALFAPRSALADVRRFAVILGNDYGSPPDAPLRYAEKDAQKVAEVLRDLGGFAPADISILRGESAETARSTLIAVNDRIRSASELPNTQTLLFVYYSGHADARALRLGSSLFDFGELAQLVRGSPATFRLLVVDACRSGTLTRVKGGRVVAPFALTDGALRGEGMAFLTASSANEDAQESDELGGSFFTHALLSGMLGAADTNQDGNVVLEEAYRYAYDATLRATSRTYAGTQHPSFRYDVRGRDSLVLTRPAAFRKSRAQLQFPAGLSFLVLRGDSAGGVVGEVGERDPVRSLSLRPGTYFLRGRAKDVLLEGSVNLAAGTTVVIDTATLQRSEYARLVRKGGGVGPQTVYAFELGAAGRTRLPNASTPCLGGVLGGRAAFAGVSLLARLGACTSRFENEAIEARTREYELSAAALRVWDTSALSVGLGAGLGAVLTTQSFETRGNAPSRTGIAPLGYVLGSVSLDLSRGYYLGLDVRGAGYLLKWQRTGLSPEELRSAFVASGALLAGKQF